MSTPQPRNPQYLSRLARNVCGRCGTDLPDDGFQTCANCRQYMRQRSGSKYAEVRRAVLEKYGNVCVACGEDDPCVLTMDHIHDDGNQERELRKAMGGDQNLYRHLHAEPRRNDLQILCANCQLRKRLFGQKIEVWPLTSEATCAIIESDETPVELEPKPTGGDSRRNYKLTQEYIHNYERRPPTKAHIRKEIAMADYSALLDRHFKVANITKPTTLTLREVKREEVGQDKEALPVAYFNEDPRGLVLNASRYATIGIANGSRDTDDWLGTILEITVDPNIRFKGKVTGGLVVRVVTPAPKKPSA